MPATRMLLALGSNVRAEHNLPVAVDLLSKYGRIVAASRVWQSRPVGYSAQPDFLNAAVMLETKHTPEYVVANVISDIERALDRRRDPNNKNAPRTIDIDLVMLEDCDFGTPILGHEIPDPEILSRAFLARPLAEVAPDWRHSGTGESLQQISQRLDAQEPGLIERPDVILCHPAAEMLDQQTASPNNSVE